MNEPELFTERLILRPMQKSDAEAVFQYKSDDEVNKYQNWIPETLNDVVDFIEKRIVSVLDVQGTWFQFVVVRKDSREIIGDIGLHFFDSQKSQVEIGCSISKEHQKQGFATEALTEILKLLFAGLNKHRVIASIDPRNAGSIQLMSRLGMRQEGHFRESLFINGEWVDDLIFAMLKREWEATQLNIS